MGQLVTAKEAEKRWCRHGSADRSRTDGTTFFRTLCLAADCMSWDWWDEESLGEARRGYCSADPNRPNKIGNEKIQKDSMGYA